VSDTKTMRDGFAAQLLGALIAVGLLFGCGGGAQDDARTPSMLGQAPASEVDLDDDLDDDEPVRPAEKRSAPTAVIALVAIDASEGTKPGSILEGVVESTEDDEGDFEVLYEWIVNGEVVGEDDELDTFALVPGDVVALSARLDFDDRTSRPVRSQPLSIGRGSAPEILSQPEGGIENGRFRYQMSARSDERGARIEYGLIEGPDGMTVDAASGVVHWRPTTDQRGKFAIELVARDQWGTGTGQAFEIHVDGPAAPPAAAR